MIRRQKSGALEPASWAEALDFIADLSIRFGGKIEELLAARHDRQRLIDEGEMPDFLPQKNIKSICLLIFYIFILFSA